MASGQAEMELSSYERERLERIKENHAMVSMEGDAPTHRSSETFKYSRARPCRPLYGIWAVSHVW